MTKQEILTRVAADVKNDATMPTAGGSEYNQWSEFLEEELSAWAEVLDWHTLKSTQTLTLGTSGTSVALPSNFKRVAGFATDGTYRYQEVEFDKFTAYGNSDRVFRIGYDPTNQGHYMETKSALAGKTLTIPMVNYPSALASPASIPNIPNPNYLVKRLKVRVFKNFQNPIFTEIEAEADLLLQQMINNEYLKYPQFAGFAPDTQELNGFTLGID